VEAGQPAQPTGTNRSIGFERRIQRQGPSRFQGSGTRYRKGRQTPQQKTRTQLTSPRHRGPGGPYPWTGGPARPGGHSEGQNTRSHPELGRENPQRRWYCALRRGRVGRRQALQALPHLPAPRRKPGAHTPGRTHQTPGPTKQRGVEQQGHLVRLITGERLGGAWRALSRRNPGESRGPNMETTRGGAAR
jgi:hypothetical protein